MSSTDSPDDPVFRASELMELAKDDSDEASEHVDELLDLLTADEENTREFAAIAIRHLSINQPESLSGVVGALLEALAESDNEQVGGVLSSAVVEVFDADPSTADAHLDTVAEFLTTDAEHQTDVGLAGMLVLLSDSPATVADYADDVAAHVPSDDSTTRRRAVAITNGLLEFDEGVVAEQADQIKAALQNPLGEGEEVHLLFSMLGRLSYENPDVAAGLDAVVTPAVGDDRDTVRHHGFVLLRGVAKQVSPGEYRVVEKCRDAFLDAFMSEDERDRHFAALALTNIARESSGHLPEGGDEELATAYEKAAESVGLDLEDAAVLFGRIRDGE